jgi:hypothetical protein
MEQLVSTLQPYFTSKAPFQLPEEWRQTIVRIAPWLVLAAAIISVLIGWPILMFALGLSAFFAYAYGATLFMWLAIAVLIVQTVLLFMSYPGLKAYKLAGWNFAFYGAMLSVAYGIVQWLQYPSNIGTLIGAAIGAVIELYILFQIRDYYTGAKKLTAKPAASASETKSA